MPSRAPKDRYDTRRLADRVEQVYLHDTFIENERAFIEARDMFFLATVDPEGRPTVSYKGGAPGFVRIKDNVLTFPVYDGNGMFISIGNLALSPKVGLLFIDFERQARLRVQGEAAIDEGPAKSAWPGAFFVVHVRPTHIFSNCARYVHRYVKLEQARHVPDARGQQPLVGWKLLPYFWASLPERDRAALKAAGASAIVKLMMRRLRRLASGD